MEERRRSKRTEMKSTLMVKRLDQGDMQEVSIDIVDVSPNGVGFLCKEVLSIGAVYESKLRIWTQAEHDRNASAVLITDSQDRNEGRFLYVWGCLHRNAGERCGKNPRISDSQ